MTINRVATPVETSIQGVWLAEGVKPGPTVAVFGGVHGNERAGITAVRKFVEEGIPLESGSVLLVPEANPRAVREDLRETEENLNRSFRDLTPTESQNTAELPYELRRAQDLIGVLEGNDVESLLDLHESHSGALPRMIITEENGFPIARQVGAQVISSGWSVSESGGTDGWMYENGRVGLCYELGHISTSARNATLGTMAIGRFLAAHGMISQQFKPLFHRFRTRYVHTDGAFIRTEQNFHMGDFRSFEELKPGTLIAEHGARQVIADRPGTIIIFPDRHAEIDSEAFTLAHEITPDK